MSGHVRTRDLIRAPEGLEQHGDELHDPNHWTACPDCLIAVPVDIAECPNCGAAIPDDDVGVEGEA